MKKQELPQESRQHLVNGMGSEDWQEVYAVLTTHKVLIEKYVTPDLEQTLLSWPCWPERGALEEIYWQGGELKIYGRYHDNWHTIDRIVALGTLLTVSHVNKPLLKKFEQ